MKKRDEMVWIKDHICKATKDIDSPRIALYRHQGEERWFYVIDSEKQGMICNQILICPYCGEILSKEIPEEMMPEPLKKSMPVIQDLYGDNARFIPSVDIEVHIHRDFKQRVSSFTCYGCCGCTEHFKEGGGRCDFAFDPYNLNGDCLMDK